MVLYSKCRLLIWSETLALLKKRIKDKPGNTNRRERFSIVDLLIRVACFVKRSIIFTTSKDKGADLD
jgi:hypothetical protein